MNVKTDGMVERRVAREICSAMGDDPDREGAYDDAAHAALEACHHAELVEALEFYANPDIYRPSPHGLAFDRRDLSYGAKSVLAKLHPTTGEA